MPRLRPGKNREIASETIAAIKFGDCIRKTDAIVEFAFEEFWNWLTSELEGSCDVK